MKSISLGSMYEDEEFLDNTRIRQEAAGGNPLIKWDDFYESVKPNAEEFLVQPLGCGVAK